MVSKGLYSSSEFQRVIDKLKGIKAKWFKISFRISNAVNSLFSLESFL